MNINQTKEEIKRAVIAYTTRDESGVLKIPSNKQRPLLLMGPPGIGKTAIMAQIAAECNICLISYTMTHHTRQSAIGLPIIEKKTYDGKEYSVTQYTLSEIMASVYDCNEQMDTQPGILFLDEINSVSETLHPAMLQFLQYKSFGGHTLPEGWIIVAAGNPIQYNRSARELDYVTLDRVRLIEIEPDFAVWRQYASVQGIHPAILAYLTLKQDQFYIVDSTGFATARGWEDASDALKTYEELGLSVSPEFFSQFIRCTETAEDFALYYALSHSLNSKFRFDIHAPSTRLEDELKNAKFDERIYATEFLSDIVLRSAEKYAEEKRLNDGLIYFINGIEGLLSRDGELIEAIEKSLDAKQNAFKKKKAYGIITHKDEKYNLDLFKLVKQLIGKIKFKTISSEEGIMLLRQFTEDLFTAEEKLNEFKIVTEKIYGVITEAFGPNQELVIFFSNLSAHSDFMRLAHLHIQKIEKEIQSTLDFDRHEDELLEQIKNLVKHDE